MFREFNALTAHIENSIAVITLNRPDHRNALSLQMMKDLVQCFEICRSSSDVRTIIDDAAGKVFCAGHDLRELAAAEPGCDRIFKKCEELMLKIQSVPQP